MRDLLIFAIVFYGLSKIFSRAHIGIYLWTWISLMSPHRSAWGPAFSFPFSQVIGLVTLIALFTSKSPKLKLLHPETIALGMLLFWVTCTTFIFAINPEGAYHEWNRFIKIQLFIFLTILLISDKAKLDGFIWVIVASIGYYGIKGGIFTIATGGGSRVWGPTGSFISGNNEIALALLIIVPLLRYLQLQETRKWYRLGLMGSMLLCMAAILGTQSRGALLGIAAVGLFLWWKSPKKLGMAMVVMAVAALVVLFMPQTWWSRMETIQTYDTDASAMGRINAWWVAFNVAKDTFTGGGAGMFTQETFAKYAPVPSDVHDVHSIYFEMLGEQGFIGFTLFLLLLGMTWLRCGKLVKQYRAMETHKWAADLGAMLQVSLIGYAVSGAFLGLAYFDGFYNLIACAVIATEVAKHQIESNNMGNNLYISTPIEAQKRKPDTATSQKISA